MDDLLTLSVRDLATAIRSKQTTSKHLTKLFLDRIEVVNPSLNAVIRLEPEIAMKHAERADSALQGGETPGKLLVFP